MADTELNGVIHLTVDKTKAEKDIKDIGGGAGAGKGTTGGAAAAGSTAGKGFATTFAAEVKKVISSSMSSMLGSFGAPGQAVGNTLRSMMSSPAAGAATSGAGAASNAAGGVGLGAGILVGAAALVGITLFAKAIKGAVTALVGFAEGLAQFSGRMGMVLGRFHMQINFMKKQIGDALAPAMGQLLQSVIALSKNFLPVVIVVLRSLIQSLAWLAGSINSLLYYLNGDKVASKEDVIKSMGKVGLNKIDPNYRTNTTSNEIDTGIFRTWTDAIDRRDKQISSTARSLRDQWSLRDRYGSVILPGFADGEGMA